ncbi:hypothetical protein [Pseudomonas sp. ANT_J28]|uniref:hypothetical protein n=1 Tax=Pseudomonas sp. ANT_J28 TaxID=2597352 RepID=UPI0011F0AC87|nr:hypothetical protein [Pseudomonas sp. ANT_J28]KAA0983318.1 hypothetical protein FQ187_12960 [Pseudomonas sp. ANT_J28]
MSDKRTLTSFDTGVIAAITLIGTALAALEPSKRDMIKSSAESLITMLPADGELADGSSAHHVPLQALIAGLYPEKSKKSVG